MMLRANSGADKLFVVVPLRRAALYVFRVILPYVSKEEARCDRPLAISGGCNRSVVYCTIFLV